MCLCQLGDLMHINVFKFHFCYRLFSQYLWETAVHLKHYRYFLLLTTAAGTKTTITTTKSTTKSSTKSTTTTMTNTYGNIHLWQRCYDNHLRALVTKSDISSYCSYLKLVLYYLRFGQVTKTVWKKFSLLV